MRIFHKLFRYIRCVWTHPFTVLSKGVETVVRSCYLGSPAWIFRSFLFTIRWGHLAAVSSTWIGYWCFLRFIKRERFTHDRGSDFLLRILGKVIDTILSGSAGLPSSDPIGSILRCLLRHSSVSFCRFNNACILLPVPYISIYLLLSQRASFEGKFEKL